MIVLDVIARMIIFITAVYSIKSVIKDIKNGDLKDFLG